MAKYKFKATKPTGEVYESTREAVDKFTLYRDLRDEGDAVVSVSELDEKVSIWKREADFGAFGKIKATEKIIFAKNLGAMIQAGLSVSRALSVMERQTKRRKLKKIFSNINDSIKNGKTLARFFAQDLQYMMTGILIQHHC